MMGKRRNQRSRRTTSRKWTRHIERLRLEQMAANSSESGEYTQAKYLIELAGWDLHLNPRGKTWPAMLFAIASDSENCITRIKSCQIARSTANALICNGVAKFRTQYTVSGVTHRIYCRKGCARVLTESSQ